MPVKLIAEVNGTPVSLSYRPLMKTIKNLRGDDDLLLAEADGNGEARITRDHDDPTLLFVDAPNNQREGLTFLTHSRPQAVHAAKQIIAAYYL